MIVGLDLRPALLSATGVARVARQAYLALARRSDLTLAGYGACWARPRPGPPLPSLRSPRIPGRLQAVLAPLGFGVETVLGRLDIFQHTDLVFPPVRRAREVLFVHDLHFLAGRGWHDASFATRVGPRLFRRAARAAALVVPCAAVADDARRRGLGPRATLAVLAPGVDHLETRARDDDELRLAALMASAGLPRRPGDELLVLLPGTREPRKNQLALVRAFLALGEVRARLLLVGPRGWGVPGLESLLADRRALVDGRGEVRLASAGEISEADYAAALRRCDVVAYPSFAEGFGLPAAEALAAGRALLTSRGTPMAELGGDAVLAVDPEDGAQLARGLSRLLADGALRAALGTRARQQVAGLTWDAYASGLAALYARILAS